jgi:uncharacterized membrane protein (DUF485 family)
MSEKSFVMDNNDQAAAKKELAVKNIRLAIILGLIAFSFYIGLFLFS